MPACRLLPPPRRSDAAAPQCRRRCCHRLGVLKCDLFEWLCSLTGVTTTFLGSKSSRPSKPCVLAKRVEILVEFQIKCKIYCILIDTKVDLNLKKHLGEYCKEFILESLTFFFVIHFRMSLRTQQKDVCMIFANKFQSLQVSIFA